MDFDGLLKIVKKNFHVSWECSIKINLHWVGYSKLKFYKATLFSILFQYYTTCSIYWTGENYENFVSPTKVPLITDRPVCGSCLLSSEN